MRKCTIITVLSVLFLMFTAFVSGEPRRVKDDRECLKEAPIIPREPAEGGGASSGWTGFHKRYKSAEVRIKVGDGWNVGGNVGVGSGGINVGISGGYGQNYITIICCKRGADIDACNFSLEDPRCGRYAQR